MTPLYTPRFRATPAIALAIAALFAPSSRSDAAQQGHAAAPSAQDPCAGSPRCFNAGSFTAEVIQVSPTAMTGGARHHLVTFNIRFRNVSDKPVILAYQSASSSARDNFGNAFTWGRPGTHDTSVKGIGMVAGRSVDTQFSLAPGQARNASFASFASTQSRRSARPGIMMWSSRRSSCSRVKSFVPCARTV